MKKLVLSMTLFFVTVTMSCALELVPKPAKMWQGAHEVHLRSTEPVVEIKADLQNEEYHLEISEDGRIILKAGSSKAAVWGRHTIEQLLAQARRKGKNIWLPTLRIADKPVFPYRGAMLDCARHFWTVGQIKTIIDVLSMHKLNVFHWHLTDNQGWRIEIKKYPELVRTGSTRPSSQISHHTVPRDERQYDGKEHSGYYTQKQIREIVKYAQERGVEIIPEIELPGHAQAALASYPWLGCRGQGYEVMTGWSRSYEVMCAGKETTLEFLKDVFDEVCELFPSRYIHIGGDEAPRNRWQKCSHCQALMKRNGYKTEAELQSYLIDEVEKHLMAKGRRIIGWDEILDGGVSKTAVVMSWRGMRGGITAARKGNDVIYVPRQYFYLDLHQSYSTDGEPMAFHKRPLPLSKTYSFQPYKDLNEEQQKYIRGIQVNLWTEYISEFDHLQRMLLPRLAAMAEVAWCGSAPTAYSDFVDRMETAILPLYDRKGFAYAPYAFETASKVINALPLGDDADLAELERRIRKDPQAWESMLKLVRDGVLEAASEEIMLKIPRK